jgi:SAM-dependent methyltransferase
MIRNWLHQTLAKTPYFWRFRDRFAPRFKGTSTYWNERYREGGNSGAGSYGPLAQFKAEFLNRFVADNGVRSVIEFGCGDGAQLGLAAYPSYIGLDVSPVAVQTCIRKYAADGAKSFFLYDGTCFADKGGLFSADLALSLDVVYHLIEDAVFEAYMRDLFHAGRRFVIVYSSNHAEVIPNTHVRHRRFTDHVERSFPAWQFVERVPQRYPLAQHGEQQGSFADFYIFRKS